MTTATNRLLFALVVGLALPAWRPVEKLPDFSGTWVAGSADGRAARSENNSARLFEIRQTKTALAVTEKIGQGPLVSVNYDLTGRDSTNTNKALGISATYRSSWDKEVLVTQIWFGPPNGAARLTERRSLTGLNEMLVETHRAGQPPVKTYLKRR